MMVNSLQLNSICDQFFPRFFLLLISMQKNSLAGMIFALFH